MRARWGSSGGTDPSRADNPLAPSAIAPAARAIGFSTPRSSLPVSPPPPSESGGAAVGSGAAASSAAAGRAHTTVRRARRISARLDLPEAITIGIAATRLAPRARTISR